MKTPSFAARIWLALILPFKVLFDARFAAGVVQLQAPALPTASEASKGEPSPGKADSEKDDSKQDAPESSKESNPDDAKESAEQSEKAARETPAVAVEAESDPTAALQLLAILQREGRFIDFIKEDMSGFSDAEIGAAARVVQEGCKRGLADYLDVESIRTEAEGAAVTLEAGYDAHATRLTGNVTGQAPYKGVLAHHGWRAVRVTLPTLSKGHDARVLAPAEVEVGAS